MDLPKKIHELHLPQLYEVLPLMIAMFWLDRQHAATVPSYHSGNSASVAWVASSSVFEHTSVLCGLLERSAICHLEHVSGILVFIISYVARS